MLYFFMGICVYIVLHKDDIFLGHEFVNLVWCSLKCVHMNYNALVFLSTFDNVSLIGLMQTVLHAVLKRGNYISKVKN